MNEADGNGVGSLSVEIFSGRWGSKDKYTFIWTPDGWDVNHGDPVTESCDPMAGPALYERFERDGVEYPEDTRSVLAQLWRDIRDDECRPEEAQRRLERLARRISHTTRNG